MDSIAIALIGIFFALVGIAYEIKEAAKKMK